MLVSSSVHIHFEGSQVRLTRDYHSVALLLPGGKVLSAGGENRHYFPATSCTPKVIRQKRTTEAADYEIFVPHYLGCGVPRPVIKNAPPVGQALKFAYGSKVVLDTNQLPTGQYVTSAVLMRAPSVTHHADTNQRCGHLRFMASSLPTPRIEVEVSKASANTLPRGYYMLFLTTNVLGVSHAMGDPDRGVWIKVESSRSVENRSTG